MTLHALPSRIVPFSLIYVRRHAWKFACIFLLEAVGNGVLPAAPYALKMIVDTVAHTPNLTFRDFLPAYGLFAAIALVGVLFNRLSGMVNMFTMPVIRIEIRRDLFNALQHHAHSYFLDNFAGSVAHRVSETAQGFSRILSMIQFGFLPLLTGMAMTLFLMFRTNWVFGTVTLAWIVLYLGISLLLARGMKKRSKLYAAATSTVSGKIVDAITNIATVRAFSRHPYEREYLDTYLDDERNKQRRMFVFLEANRWFQDLSNFALMSAMLFLALACYLRGLITVGDTTLIFSLSYALVHSVERVAMNVLDTFEAAGTFKDALEAINKPYQVIDAPDALPLAVAKGEVTYENIHFGYREGTPLFEGLNIRIPAGQRVGFVGFSGSGKTTFVNLLLRLFDLQDGRILLDGQDIAHGTQASLREHIALIPQDPLLFHRSLMDNIRYGRVGASDAEVIAAATQAGCHEFIESLPEGYASLVGERGVKLSGGQRQRIAIARAILKRAPILVMDEATSSLDSVTERAIQENLDVLMQGRTVIVIAHRLSTIAHLDRIVVFDKGHIVEDGSHAELLGKNGHYARLWHMQAGGFLPEKEEAPA